MEWPQVPLGEVIRHRKEFIEIKPDESYARCRVQTAARGIVLRDKIAGAKIKTKRQQVCRAGEFLVAEIDAKMGGYGIVPNSLEGAIVSSHYFLYELDEKRILQDYLNWYSKTEHFFGQVNARGSTNYAAIRPSNVLDYQIPLPPFDEQRRIAARLDRVAALVGRARRLLERLDRDAVLLTQSLHTHLSSERRRPFGEFIELWEDRETVEPETFYPQIGIKGYSGGLFTKASVRGSETSYRAFNRLHEGLLVVSQPKGWEGAVAICDQAVAGWFVSPEYRTFRCKEGHLLPHYLDMLIRTPWFQTQLTKLKRGQGARRERLRPEMLLMMETKMPSVGAQAKAIRIADRCSSLRAQREMTASDLNAFVPAMLREVFGGEAHATP